MSRPVVTVALYDLVAASSLLMEAHKLMRASQGSPDDAGRERMACMAEAVAWAAVQKMGELLQGMGLVQSSDAAN